MAISSRASWVSVYRSSPLADFRLFCFPNAGGGPLAFRPWSLEAPSHVEVCGILLPGREQRLSEPPFRTMTALVQALSEGLLPWLDRPFAFFGHSMGSVVAYELSRALRAQDAPMPVHLFVSARRAPHMPSHQPIYHTLQETELVSALRGMGGTPELVLTNRELMDIFLPIIRADFETLETYTYQPGPPLTLPITALRGLEDRLTSAENMQAWGELTRGPFRRLDLPGDHFFVHSGRGEVLKVIGQALRG